MIKGRDWFISICHSKTDECKQFTRFFKESMMFPLSETLNETINLGYLDTYEWQTFEAMF